MEAEPHLARRTSRRPGAPRRRGDPLTGRLGALTALALALLSLLPVAGLLGAEGEGSEIWERLFRGRTRVDVVDLEVRVNDERGRPVLGLTRDDFRVLVEGRPVPFDNFFAVEAASEAHSPPAAGVEAPGNPAVGTTTEPPSPAPFLAIYVDHANLSERDRSQVLGAVRELLARVPGPLRGTVLTNERELVVHQPLTTSRQELLAALERVETASALRSRFESDRRQLLLDIQRVDVEKGSGVFAIKPRPGPLAEDDDAGTRRQETLTTQAVVEARSVLTRIRTYARQRTEHSRATLEVLRRLVATVGGLPGRKAVLVLTGGLPLRPGEALYEAYSRRFEALSDVSANFHPDAESARDDATPALERLLDEANASRVSFYLLDAAPTRTLNTGSAETAHILAGTFATWDDGIASLEQQDAQAGLRRLGRETGGGFAPTAASWGGLVDRMFTDTASYYSLGIPGRALAPEGESQRIEVEVRGRGLEVRHPASLRRLTLRERAARATSSALGVGAADDPLGIVVEAAPEERLDGGTYRVPLSVRVPLDRIVLLPGAGEHTARVWLLVAVRDAERRTSEVAEHVCPIWIPNEEVLTAAGRSAVCGVRLEMRGGSQRVAVTVLDEAAGLIATTYRTLDIGAEDRLDTTN